MTPAELRLLVADNFADVEIITSEGDLYLVQIRYPGGTSLLTHGGAAMCFHSLAECSRKLSSLGIDYAWMVSASPYDEMINNADAAQHSRMPLPLS